MRNLARGNPARWWRSRSCGSASRAPVALFISPLRRWSTIFILLFILLFIAGTWYVTNPTRLSRLSAVLLSRVLGGEVTVRSGYLSLSGTLMLSGVEVRAADRGPDDVPIFTAQQVEARFDWFSLLTGQLSATQLVATTPVFQPVEDAETGHWNYERLHPGFGGGAPSSSKGLTLPVVILRDARVKWSELRQGRVHQTAENIINGEMIPDAVRNTTYHFRFVQANADQGAAGGTGAMFRGTWDSADSIFQSTTENVVMTESLRNSLPRVARQWCAEHQLAGRLSRLDLAFSPRTGLTVTVNFEGIAMMSMVEPEQGIGVAEDRPAYPLSVQNVGGQIVFSRDQSVASQPATAVGTAAAVRDPNIIRINDLHGAVLGYQFVLNGEIRGATADAPFNFTLRFPDAVVGDRYPPLFMAFLSSQDLIQRMEPHGRMDILVDLHRDVPRGTVLYGGQIDLKDARLRYAHFPAPLDHVNGRLTFDHRSVTFHQVTGKADQIDVGLDGTCGTVWSNHFVDITITSPNMALDDGIAACMPDEYQDIWNLFALRGKGKLLCRITRADSMLERQKMVVDYDLTECSGYLRAIPYPFTQATGHLHMEADEARIEHFTARTGADGSGRVTLDGVVRHEGDDVTSLRPELRIVADVPVDDSLLHAFPETLTAKLAGVTPGGRLGFEGTVRRDVQSGSVQVAGNLNWKQGTLQMQFGQQPLAFSDINAQATLTPTTLDVKDFAASLDAGKQKIQTQLSGKFDFTNRFSGLMHLSLAGKSITLPEVAPPIFPQSWRDTWREYSPSGSADLSAEGTFRVNLPANPGAKQPALVLSDTLALESYAARLALHEVTLKPPSWPDALTKIDGKIEILPGVVSMTGMTAALGNVAFAWDGQADPSSGKISLSGKADTKGYSSTWVRYVPDSIANYFDKSQDDVSLSLRFDSLAREAPDKPWALEGKLQAANLASTGPVPINIKKADLTVKALFDPGTSGLDFAGNMVASNLVVSDRQMETLTARLAATANTHDISITEIDGKVAGGTLQGNIRIRTQGQASATAPGASKPAATTPGLAAPPLASVPSTTPATAASLAELPAEIINDGGYVANLVLHDADISHLVLSDKATDEERQKVGTGRVTASLSLQETFGPHFDRTGRGDLVIRDGEIYNVPLSMGLMQIATLRLPVARSFQVANSSYYLRNSDVTFERILLESPGINLAGMGTVSIDSRKIDMSFVTESQREVSIPLLTPVIDDIRRGLLELSVTGTVDDPKITPVPLSAISNFLRSLLPKPRASTK